MPAMPLAIVDVTAQAAYPAAPQVTCDFTPDSWLVAYEDDSAGFDIYFSFDGVEDHGRIRKGQIPAIEWLTRATELWLRVDAAGVGVPNSKAVVMAGSDK